MRVAIGLIPRQGRFFLQRRGLDAKIMPGLWEFPGGKVEPGETPMAGLLRELREELDWVPDTVTPMEPFSHPYPENTVELHPFLCRGADPVRSPLAWGWFAVPQLQALPVPEANKHWIRTLPTFLQVFNLT